ncbi:MAG: hypothetical protein CVT92_02275 [Bacteroidetes bacterium HGW-Bacteroidetes-1]|jgi:hypothetical protein|nr:MAG: hypothetical protein CVT92_02275 [Bacteroidetes bacterium HGW-Bacteroidetes-1]
MIQLPPFKHIFPINRTRIFPSWGNSYVDNWVRFETFIGGVDVNDSCVMYFGTPSQPDRPDIWERFANCQAPRMVDVCVASFPHPGRTP